MVHMNENQTKEYIKGLEFSLKDKARTEDKYSQYKTEDFKFLLVDSKEDIEDYFYYLEDRIKNHLVMNPFKMDFLRLNEKKHIRMFKTLINSITYELNNNFIGGLDYFNDNTKRNFTILFYLNFYSKINKIMKNVLTEFVLEYPKKAVVERLTV